MLRKAALALSFVLTFGAINLTRAADVQEPGKVYRIGFLAVTGPPASDRTLQNCPTNGRPGWQALVQGLRERGYVQGQNLVIECRYTEGREEHALALAKELVSLKVDLLVVAATSNVRAAKQATSTIPIIMIGVMDPAGRGLVASLARPGGNVTGLADDAGTEMGGKYLQLLKEAVPKVSSVAMLGYGSDPPDPREERIFRASLHAAAQEFHVTLQYYAIREPEKLEGAFAAMAKQQADALVVLPHPFMWTHAQRIVDLAAQNRLPALYPGRTFVLAGGLLAYDADDLAISRRVGVYVDNILKGAKPADLPVEQPTKFELVINLKTARALGITIPKELLVRADEVIQ